MRGKWLFGLIAIFFLGLAGGASTVQATDAEHFQAVGLIRFGMDASLPDLSLPDVEGKDVPLRSFLGKVVLLNFWTTW